jgi:hypothetical protein
MIKTRIKNKPYNVLLYFAVLILLISLLVDQSLSELHLYDTYFITEMAPFMQVTALVVLFIWVIYLLTGRFLYSVNLTWIHVMLTIIGSVMFITLISRGITRTFSADGNTIESIGFVVDLKSTLFIAVLGQLLYFLNLFQGLFRK